MPNIAKCKDRLYVDVLHTTHPYHSEQRDTQYRWDPTCVSQHYTEVLFTGLHSNQDLIWCVKTTIYMGFWAHRGF